MADFINALANIYAQSQPQFRPQQGRPTILPFTTGTTKAGFGGEFGKNLGEGASEGFIKTYVEPQQEQFKKQLMWDNDPQIIAQRAEIMAQKYWMMPPEKQKLLRENKEWTTFWTKANGIGIPTSSAVDPETGKEYHVPAGGPSLEAQKAVGTQGLPENLKPWRTESERDVAQTNQANAATDESKAKLPGLKLDQEIKETLHTFGVPYDQAFEELATKRAETGLREAQTGQAQAAAKLMTTQSGLESVKAERERLSQETSLKAQENQLESQKIMMQRLRVDEARLRAAEGKATLEDKRLIAKEKLQYFNTYDMQNREVDKATKGPAGLPPGPKQVLQALSAKVNNLNGLRQSLGEDGLADKRVIKDTTAFIDAAYGTLALLSKSGKAGKAINSGEVAALKESLDDMVSSMIITKETEAGEKKFTYLPLTVSKKLEWINNYMNHLKRKEEQPWYSLTSLPEPPLVSEGGKK